MKRTIMSLCLLASVSGCGSEYSRAPEPRGSWVPANPPTKMAAKAAQRPVVPAINYAAEK